MTMTNKVLYDGDGSTIAFSIPFFFLSNDDIEVILRDATNTETRWTLGTQFTLSGAAQQSGGTLTVVTSPMNYTPQSGEKLLIKRVLEYAQPTDRLTMLTQQLKETLDRAVLVPETDGAASLIADIDSVRANKLAGWAADGSLTTYNLGAAATPVEDDGTQVVAAPTALNFVGAGVTVTDVSGKANISIPGGGSVAVKEEGTQVVGAPSALNFVGTAVTAADSAGEAQISVDALVPGNNLSDVGNAATARSNIGAEAADPDLLKADVTDNLTVGFTSDVEAVTFNANITPDITGAVSKTLTASGDWTLNAPSNAAAGGFVMRVTNSGGMRELTLGANVHNIGLGTYDTAQDAVNIIVGIFWPGSPAKLDVTIRQEV